MPHLRERIALPLLRKKLRFSPVVAIQGVRQCGKSVLVRDLLAARLKSVKYDSLDNPDTYDFARHSALTFLQQSDETEHHAIDEAQKVPNLFDAVKFIVDRKRIPGRFILLGSTEFSTLFRIRESLTGRMSRIRLFPLLALEALEKQTTISKAPFCIAAKPTISRTQLLRHLERGGMPAIFSVRSSAEYRTLIKDWLELSCLRDVPNIPRGKYDGQLCMRILEEVARLEHPDSASIAAKLRRDGRVIRSHIEALKSLFVINELPPHPLGTGKPIYFLCDVGFASYLNASFEKKLWTWALQEVLAKRSYGEDAPFNLTYYRSSKGSVLHLVEQIDKRVTALKIISEERITELDLRLLRSFQERSAGPAKLLALGSQRQKREDVDIHSWESLA